MVGLEDGSARGSAGEGVFAKGSLYLDLMERCLLNTLYEDPPASPWHEPVYDPVLRDQGLDWPSAAHTMIGRARLRQLRDACAAVIDDGIPGDFLEAGVWRGGAAIMMRAVLEQAGRRAAGRRVWAADSFAGIPPPDAMRFPADAGSTLHSFPQLAVDLESVKRTFARYGLLDDRVVFLPGRFSDTLATAPVDRLAVLRLDGDLYESTWTTLEALYPRLSPGGYAIVDDYGCFEGCRAAVDAYRGEHRVGAALRRIDAFGVYWIKEAGDARHDG